MDILGIRIDDLSKKEILDRIEVFLNDPRFHQIATVNPEFILEAEKNLDFKNILNSSDLNVADGMGIGFAFLRHLKYLQCRMAGADLMMEILRLASEKGLSVYIAARKDGLSSFEEIRNSIRRIYPRLKIDGEDIKCHPSAVLAGRQESGDPVSNLKVSTLDSRLRGNDNKGIILFCNFGAPHQEFFINRVKCDKIRLAMGVGGSFDFLTGKIKRAPRFLRLIGLEWLWRFLQEPEYRWKRILRAVIIFPIRVIFNR